MPQVKRLVVDVDDTILVTTAHRDYRNSIPNWPMINKLNALYDQGWEIIYHTARGMVSKDEDLDLIMEEVYPVLISWMSDHRVKFTEVRMMKPFGQYYIDDKALRPDEFLAMNFEEFEGRSGAKVFRSGPSVVKICEKSEMQTQWYSNCPSTIRTPKIISSSPTDYRMEFIHPSVHYPQVSEIVLKEQFKAIDAFARTKPMRDYSGTPITFIDRCLKNMPDDIRDVIKPWALEAVLGHEENTFCHGDLTLDNTIVSANGVYFIDPSIQKGIWSHWMIDIGRIMQSWHSNYEHHFKGREPLWEIIALCQTPLQREMDRLCGWRNALIMELLTWCRIYPYFSDEDKEKIMRKITCLIKDLK